MAVNVHRYEADSNKLVGYLTPFFIRGKKVLQFLSAICSPLNDVNATFTSWAKEMIEDAVTTTQPIILIWSLNERFRKYFNDSNSSFQVRLFGGGTQYIYETQEELAKYPDTDDIYLPEDINDTVVTDTLKIVIFNANEDVFDNDDITIIAPSHNTLLGDTEYRRRINQRIKTYLVYDTGYNIAINKD